MLHAEPRLHAESGALLDGERMVLEIFQCVGLLKIQDDVGSAFNFETQRKNDHTTRIFGVRDGSAGANSKRLLPFSQRLVVLV